MTQPLSVAHLTALQLAPPDFIHCAAKAGFDAVGLRLIRVTAESPGYPLMDDPAMLRETRTALQHTGLAVHDIEFVKITPDTDISALLPFLDAGAALGARQVITAPYDPDLERLADRLAALSEAATSRGLGVVLEFFPWTTVPDLAGCWDVVRRAGGDVGILPDSLHFDRSGSSLELLRSLPADRVRFAHLCDAPVQSSYSEDQLLHAARAERLPPGEGEINLAAYLRALPPGIPLGLEVPMASRMQAEGPDKVLGHLHRQTLAFLNSLPDEAL